MVMTPCKADPAAFSLAGSVPVTELIEACMSCPILAQCRADYTANPDDQYGVIAGLYRPWPVGERDGMQIGEQKWNYVINWLLDFCDTAEPGTELPPSRKLSKLIGVARPGVNLALHELEARGLLTPAIRKGRSVCRYTLPLPGSFELEEAEAS